jgi:DNA-binding MarR family transcriptional regulator
LEIHPDSFLGYWLFYAQRSVAYAFYEALKACCQEHNKPYSITPPQWGILYQLTQNDGLTIGTLSQKGGIDAPTVTGIVKRLEHSGLVERVHDREDRRVVKVYLTNEGRDIMHHLPGAVKAFNDIMTDGFTLPEQQGLIAKLQKIIANLSAVGPGMGDRFGLLPDFVRLDPPGEEPED